jgi:Glycosyltransferases involved in cell wall biogenesis
MTTSPQVTVIIPTYNWSTVLPYSVGSVLKQTFRDFEVLVVGDGCTDDSESVIKAIGDDRVRWINLPRNTGHQSEPNNEGLRQARGEFIAYLGHDDLWLPHHLSCMVIALENGADLAFSITENISPGGRFKQVLPFRLTYTPGAWIPPTGLAHRRSVTDHVGNWRHYRELDVDPEVDLWQRAYDGGHRFVFVPRLTALKFSASERPGVYKKRPHREQEKWFDRIQAKQDFEASELAELLASAENVSPGSGIPYSQLLRDLVSETGLRIRRRLRSIMHPSPKRAKQSKGDALAARRVIKGLGRKP